MKRTIIVATLLLTLSMGAALAPAQADHSQRFHEGAILVEDTVATHPGWWAMGADANADIEDDDPGGVITADVFTEDPSMLRWVKIGGASEAYEVTVRSEGAVVGGLDVFEHFSEESNEFSITPDCTQDLATRHLPGQDESIGSYLDRTVRLAVVNHQTTLPGDTVSDEASATLPARDGGYLLAVYVRAGAQDAELTYEIAVDDDDLLQARELDRAEQPRAALGLPYDTFTLLNNLGPCTQELLDEHQPPEPAASLLPDLGDAGPSFDELFDAELGQSQGLEMPSTLTTMAGTGNTQAACVGSGYQEHGFLRLGSPLSEDNTVTEEFLLEPLDGFSPSLVKRQISGLDAYIIDLRCDDLVGADISLVTDQPDIRVVTDHQLGMRFYDRVGFETGPQYLEEPGEDPTAVDIPVDTQFVAIWATQCLPGVELTPIGQACISFDATVVH